MKEALQQRGPLDLIYFLSGYKFEMQLSRSKVQQIALGGRRGYRMFRRNRRGYDSRKAGVVQGRRRTIRPAVE